LQRVEKYRFNCYVLLAVQLVGGNMQLAKRAFVHYNVAASGKPLIEENEQ